MADTPDRVAVVIEDDADVRELIDVVLTQSGFRTVQAADGESGLAAVLEHRPVLTTVDVQMPGMDGLETTRRIREISSTYLIMVTALADEDDVVRGFEAGADDYLVKPFRARELWARAQSMLRRPRQRTDVVNPATWALDAARDLREGGGLPQIPGVSASDAAAASLMREHAGLVLDPATRTATLDGAPLELTRTEFDLLGSLLETGRRVRSKADLVLAVRSHLDSDDVLVTNADKRAVEVHVANLRRKLADDPHRPRFVETVRGVGYRLAEAAG
jgi:DNA-binding response OmpR family regulator